MKKLKKNQGFTLIELLAVIVILAVIALIATPIIIGIIEDSKLKAYENSAYGIIDSAKYYYTQGLLKPESKIEYNKDILDKLTYNGGKPKEGSSAYINANGEVAVALLYGNKCYVKEYNEEKLKEENPSDCEVTIPTTISSLKEAITKGLIVTTGSGLYKMSDTEYRYRGGCTVQKINGSYTCTDVDPINNYVSIDNQKYRIISVDNQGIKIISEKKLATAMPFDVKTSTTEGPRNNANNTFCQVLGGANYYGCNVYAAISGNFTNGIKTGIVTQNSSLYNYLNTTGIEEEVVNLRESAINVTWNMGWVTKGDSSSIEIIKSEEIGATAVFKVGLMNMSDYVQATINIRCQANPFEGDTINQCKENNWLFDMSNSWMLNSAAVSSGTSSEVWFMNNDSQILNYSAATTRDIRPVAYISSDTLVKGGDGTSANPWVIE